MVSRRSSEWTMDFHKSVLRLAHEFSAEELAWNVSQEILDKVWWDRNAAAAANNETAKESGGNPTTLSFFCQSCGFQLHPGWKGTTLRIKRPTLPKSLACKRTLKRRALRKKKKAALEQEQRCAKDRPPRGHRNQSMGSSKGGESTDPLYLLRDDSTIGPLDRNHLVLTCGRCGDKTCLKGMKREPPIPLQWKQPPPKTPAGSLSASDPADGGAGVKNLSGNFEHLPKLSKKKQPPNSSSAQSLRGTPTTTMTTTSASVSHGKSLLEQKLQKKSKKKKKPPAKKSGNLMDFLSSLNDH